MRIAIFALLAACCRGQISTPLLGYVPVESRVRILHGIPAAGKIGDALWLDRELAMITVSPRQDYLLGVDASGSVNLVVPGGPSKPIADASPNPDAIVISPRGLAAALIFESQNRVQVITGLPASPLVHEANPIGRPNYAVSDNGVFLGSLRPLAFFNHSDFYVELAADKIIAPGNIISRDNTTAISAAITADDQSLVIAGPNGSIALVNLTTGAQSDFDCGCRIAGLFGLSNSVFRLNGGGLGQPLMLFDAANARLLAVPGSSIRRFGNLADIGPKTTPAALPAVTIGGLPASSGPAQQPAMTISIASSYPSAINGTATLTFTPAAGSGDDQTIQFTTGGRAVNFTIPQGATAASFSGKSSVGVMTGTVAGAIKITLSFSSQGSDITPSPAPSAAITTLATVPFIQNVQLVQTNGGFQVLVTGFSSTRDMVNGTFSFASASNVTLTGSFFTVSLGEQFVQWYSNPASNAFGSQFLLTAPFTTTNGPPQDIIAVTVTLTNSKGTSNSAVSQ